MALETATYISGLVNTNPVANDPKSEGDNHIRLLKATLLNTFPAITGAVTATHTELNIIDGLTASTAELNIMDGVTSSTAELNILDGVTASTAELNFVDGVTSNIQAQIDLKAPLASPALTGTPTAPTAAAGTSTTQVATTAFAAALAFQAALPSQTGNGGKFVTTDGSAASWSAVPDEWPIAAAGGTVDAITADFTPNITLTDKQRCCVVCAGANTSTTPTFAPDGLTAHTITMNGGQALSAGSISAAGFVAQLEYNSANTRWELMNPAPQAAGATTGASVVLLSEVSAPVGTPVATVTFDGTFDSTYDLYEIHALDVKSDTNNTRLEIRVKIGGTFQVLNTLYATTTPGTYATDATNGTIIPDMGNATPTANTASFVARLFKPSEANVGKFIHFLGAQYTSQQVDARLVDGNNAAVTGLRFQGSSGNISGTFRLYGYRKA